MLRRLSLSAGAVPRKVSTAATGMDTRFSMLLPRLNAYQADELPRIRRRDEHGIRLRSSRTQPKSVACLRGNPG